MTISAGWTTPRSPWSASAGCRKLAAVPVLRSVAATFAAMIPDLPMPVTTTWPLQLWRRSSARSNDAPSLRDQSENRPRLRLQDVACQRNGVFPRGGGRHGVSPTVRRPSSS